MAAEQTETRESMYTIGYGKEPHAMMSRRTAAQELGFLMPHLRSGTRLLDCGSGPGTITIGLAEAIAPGEVVGIDTSPTQIKRARELAVEHDVANVRFELGSILELPFEDASFDAVIAHAVLMHLREPIMALREMRRVLRPGGIAAARDHGVTFREPRIPAIDTMYALASRLFEASVGRPTQALGMSHRQLLVEAGFARAEGFVDVAAYGEPTALRQLGAFTRGYLNAEELRQIAATIGISTSELDQLADDLDAWSERPDAMAVIVWSAGIGWID